MAAFEDFYKAVKQLLYEDKAKTETQKAAYLKGVERAKPFIDIISQKNEELGLTQEESYVLAYLMEHRPIEKTTFDETLMQLAYMTFVHNKKDIIIELYHNAAARLNMIKSISAKDLEELKLNRNDGKVAALLKNEAPGIDDILDVIGFDNAIAIYEKHNKYRTKAKAEKIGAITNMPDKLAVVTFPGYQNSISLNQSGGAYLQPLSSTDGLKFKKGKMYFDGAHMQAVSEVELQNLKTKEGIEDIDLPILRIFYSLILTQFEANNHEILQDVLTIRVPALAEFMGLQSNLNKKNIAGVINKTQSYHNIVGIVHATRNGKPVQSLYPVLNFEGYNDKTNTISFSSPYMNYVIRTVYGLSLRKNKDGKVKFKKSGEPLRLPCHSYLIDSSITKEFNKTAVENVVIIVTLIEQAGDNIPRIKASTLIERNAQLARRLEMVKNPSQLLKRTFTKTWELLRTKTKLTEVYKEIELPDPKNPAFIPTLKTLNKIVFTFPHKGKK